VQPARQHVGDLIAAATTPLFARRVRIGSRTPLAPDRRRGKFTPAGPAKDPFGATRADSEDGPASAARNAPDTEAPGLAGGADLSPRSGACLGIDRRSTSPRLATPIAIGVKPQRFRSVPVPCDLGKATRGRRKNQPGPPGSETATGPCTCRSRAGRGGETPHAANGMSITGGNGCGRREHVLPPLRRELLPALDPGPVAAAEPTGASIEGTDVRRRASVGPPPASTRWMTRDCSESTSRFRRGTITGASSAARRR